MTNEEEKVESLNQVLAYAKTAPFYSNRIGDNKLTSLAELKTIPITTKQDLREQSPYGLLATDISLLAQYHESSGTTGQPVSIWYSAKDLKEITDHIATSGVTMTNQDVVLIRFPYALSTISHFLHEAVQTCGGCVIPADSRTTITPMPKVIDLLSRLRVTVLACIPLQAIMLAEMAKILGFNPRTDFPNLRAICTAGEPLSPFKRDLIEEIWGVPVFDNYGMTEIGTAMVDCQEQQLHLFEEMFHVEILKDDFQNEVKDGEVGNLVITTLRNRATPLIRYATGDLVQRKEKKCLCGKGQPYVIRGRKEESLLIQDQIFDIYELEAILSPLTAKCFWVAGTIDDQLYLLIEKENDNDQVGNEYIKVLEDYYNINLFIYLLDKGTLYDRSEPLAFGMKAKPRYFLTETELKNLLSERGILDDSKER